MTKVRNRVSSSAIEAEWKEIQLAQQNPKAFSVLYERYYERIFRFVYNRSAEEALAADITAQVFIKAMNKIGTYVNKGVPFSAWLYRIASNEVAGHFRANSKRKVVVVDQDYLHNMKEETDDGEALEIKELRLEELKAIIQTLKPTEIQLLELRFFEKHSFLEIAEIVGISYENAKVKTYRLLQKMKKRFK